MTVIVENDVRLLRRLLVCLNYGEMENVVKLDTYLRQVRELNFQLSRYIPEAEWPRYLNRFNQEEQLLARQYGFVWLPDHVDTIFLNRKWKNPFTLYVRLLQVITELGELGELFYQPKAERPPDWADQVEEMKHFYRGRVPTPEQVKKLSIVERLARWASKK